RQHTALHALHDPWLPPGAPKTLGNNAVAFFDSMIDRDGIYVGPFDDDGNDTLEYGPEPDETNLDFFAHATGGNFIFPYDPANSVNDYSQADGFPGEPFPAPDPDDVANNAKI